jgi:hypothetical protein
VTVGFRVGPGRGRVALHIIEVHIAGQLRGAPAARIVGRIVFLTRVVHCVIISSLVSFIINERV